MLKQNYLFDIHFIFLNRTRRNDEKQNTVENPGIDPGTSHMLSERSTT